MPKSEDLTIICQRYADLSLGGRVTIKKGTLSACYRLLTQKRKIAESSNLVKIFLVPPVIRVTIVRSKVNVTTHLSVSFGLTS